MLGGFAKLKTWSIACLNVALITAVALLVVDVVWGVVTRYLLGEQATWTEELARFLLVWVAMLGSAVAFGTKGHLGVDYFVGQFDPAVQQRAGILSSIAVLFFAIAIFLVGGCQVVYDALVLEQRTPALGWKMGYVYLVLPLAGCFIILFTLEDLVQRITTETPDQ